MLVVETIVRQLPDIDNCPVSIWNFHFILSGHNVTPTRPETTPARTGSLALDSAGGLGSALRRLLSDPYFPEARQDIEGLPGKAQVKTPEPFFADKQIAAELGTGEQNVKIHRGRLMRKMGVSSIAELARVAERLGIAPAN